LEHWGLINFNLEAANKANNTIIPKAYNFKSPIYLDISTLTKPERKNKKKFNFSICKKNSDYLFQFSLVYLLILANDIFVFKQF
jgi:hypothetical protein